MASILSIRLLLFVCICFSWTLIVDAMAESPVTSNNQLQNLFFRLKHVRSGIPSDPNSMNHSPTSLPSLSNIDRRNVIMPRICYFARISGTGARQKLCLPYNDNLRP